MLEKQVQVQVQVSVSVSEYIRILQLWFTSAYQVDLSLSSLALRLYFRLQFKPWDVFWFRIGLRFKIVVTFMLYLGTSCLSGLFFS